LESLVWLLLPAVIGWSRRTVGCVELSTLSAGLVVQSPRTVSSECDPPARSLSDPLSSTRVPLYTYLTVLLFPQQYFTKYLTFKGLWCGNGCPLYIGEESADRKYACPENKLTECGWLMTLLLFKHSQKFYTHARERSPLSLPLYTPLPLLWHTWSVRWLVPRTWRSMGCWNDPSSLLSWQTYRPSSVKSMFVRCKSLSPLNDSSSSNGCLFFTPSDTSTSWHDTRPVKTAAKVLVWLLCFIQSSVPWRFSISQHTCQRK